MTDEVVDEQLFAVGIGPPRSMATPSTVVPKRFRHYDQSQQFLIPPSLDEWLPEGHDARFISDAVEDLLDLTAIYASYSSADGAPPYEPRMMLKLVLYGYSIGVTSSRAICRRGGTDVAFRWLSGNATPDHRSVSRFRRRHLADLEDLFTQVLRLCGGAGLLSLGRVALDGTKLRASASRHKAMSYDHMVKKTDQLRAEVAAILAEAEAIDRVEDELYGADRRGDEIDPELLRRETRIAKMRVTMDAIESEAKEKAAAKAAETAQKKGASPEEVDDAASNAAETAVPAPKAQRNFTDPDARIMKTADGSFHYAQNAQAVVDESHQVVLCAVVTQQANDVHQLFPMIEKTNAELERAGIEARPRVLLADAGYCSADNLLALVENGTNALVATGRLAHGEEVPLAPRGPIPKSATPKQRMARRLRSKVAKADYARRKAIVEPVFGQMKTRQHAGQLRLRGLVGAQGEWTLHCICHNLRKLANAAGSATFAPA
ncbi:MAG: IS1182 family transposase [Acidimicrobiales bacterium]